MNTLSMVASSAHIYFVFISATDDVLPSDSQRVDTAPSLTLQDMDALQGRQVPHLKDHAHNYYSPTHVSNFLAV